MKCGDKFCNTIFFCSKQLMHTLHKIGLIKLTTFNLRLWDGECKQKRWITFIYKFRCSTILIFSALYFVKRTCRCSAAPTATFKRDQYGFLALYIQCTEPFCSSQKWFYWKKKKFKRKDRIVKWTLVKYNSFVV